jgi:hypothetical protein
LGLPAEQLARHEAGQSGHLEAGKP